ncbi:MAG: rRNA maturation RNase YbeY [Bacteroidales bacterium]|nr:rRNA maturation RNase YbeY [Bacteroidales bacterium]
MKINFFYDIHKKNAIVDTIVVEKRIKNLLRNEGKKLGEINITFTSNQRILEVNEKFLGHHYYTDVITFNYCVKNVITGDLLISIDQVEINARKYNFKFEKEILRVILHGVLHLVGYNDSSEEEIRMMRKKEDTYLCGL